MSAILFTEIKYEKNYCFKRTVRYIESEKAKEKKRIMRREDAIRIQENNFKENNSILKILLEEKKFRDRDYFGKVLHEHLSPSTYPHSYPTFNTPKFDYEYSFDYLFKNDKEYKDGLDSELYFRLKDLKYPILDNYYHEFARTLDRTKAIKDEFMLVLTKMNCIKACRAIKEELMAAAWHPDRIMKWLASGRSLGDINGEV